MIGQELSETAQPRYSGVELFVMQSETQNICF